MPARESLFADRSLVSREQYERAVALLAQAVGALDLATAALAAEMPKRAILTAQLATVTHELRASVGAAITQEEAEHGKAG